MNEVTRTELLRRMDAMIADCASQVKALEQDERRDEAVFANIRMNVYDIFRTVLKTAFSQPNPEAFFLEKLDQIPASWRTSLSMALQHGKDEKAHIEQTKLDAAAQIRSLFLEVCP